MKFTDYLKITLILLVFALLIQAIEYPKTGEIKLIEIKN